MAFSCYSVFLRTSPTPIQLPPRLFVLDLCVCLCVYAVRMKLQSHDCGSNSAVITNILCTALLWSTLSWCHTHIHCARQGGRKETRVGFSKNWSIQHAGKHSQLEWEKERRERDWKNTEQTTANLENANTCYCCV